MGLFSISYQNEQGKCVYAKGGLKFRSDENTLRSYFAPILPHISLNDIIGESVFWSMLPSTSAVWIFPLLLYFKGGLFALIASLILQLILEVGHLLFYSKKINYIIFILGNGFLAFVFYLILVIMLIISGQTTEAMFLGIWFLFFTMGGNEFLVVSLAYLLLFLPSRIYFKKTREFLILPKSDQILKNVSWYYARKFRIDQTKWKMYTINKQTTSSNGEQKK